MKDFWNERYNEKKYVYGEQPNLFFAEELKKLNTGKIFLPCEGEGRNAVFAAKIGWNVQAFDFSESAKVKAEKLAKQTGVSIDYEIEDITSAQFDKDSADAVALIYAHFPAAIRKEIHQKAIGWLKPGGVIILEAFNPKQLGNPSGGPKDLSMLYTEDMLQEDFKPLENVRIETLETYLEEGDYHKGKADIIRLIGIKNED